MGSSHPASSPPESKFCPDEKAETLFKVKRLVFCGFFCFFNVTNNSGQLLGGGNLGAAVLGSV